MTEEYEDDDFMEDEDELVDDSLYGIDGFEDESEEDEEDFYEYDDEENDDSQDDDY